ncbi:MAG: prepilin-type N-terminal cleavage/methylation domain-containing protein [Zoogloeaceae bacterium]|jgi:prepilin-type N-terminal cleavage/methylation domain-containing protein|nr:prepilin-type N-terminal cleavage/methylation domain-containing protein [Zoogloeaceae bacterium]
MSFLSKLRGMSRADLQSIDASAVKGRALRRRFESIRNKQGGFTLLELLVVVAILAAIAGTATIMLQDTDRKGAAAAHVAMMDELSKGIQTFRVLNHGRYPDVWDSLLGDAGVGATAAAQDGTVTATGLGLSATISDDLAFNLETRELTEAQVASLNTVGITSVRLLDTTITDYSCTDADIRATIADKGNDVTAQNIFRSNAANGCGANTNHALADGDVVAFWAGSPERVGAQLGANPALVAFGAGADSTLFDPSIIGALSNVPVYRHVEADEYNRFVVLFNVDSGEASFQAIIDGAGDTKDEELGEVDNVRTTL